MSDILDINFLLLFVSLCDILLTFPFHVFSMVLSTQMAPIDSVFMPTYPWMCVWGGGGGGDIVFWHSLNIGHNLYSWAKSFSLVPRSRSSAKVKVKISRSYFFFKQWTLQGH